MRHKVAELAKQLPTPICIEISNMEYEKWLSDSPLNYKKKLIGEFLQETVVYAEKHMGSRLNEIQDNDQSYTEKKINRISKWFGYIEFQKHTIKELQTTKIDRMIP